MSISTIGKITDAITVIVHPSDIRNVQITNADRIRGMTDEELAEFLDDEYPRNKEEWFKWLKEEATDG